MDVEEVQGGDGVARVVGLFEQLRAEPETGEPQVSDLAYHRTVPTQLLYHSQGPVRHALIACRKSGPILGAAALSRTARDGEYFVSIGVLPPWRRHGFARRMLNALRRHAIPEGILWGMTDHTRPSGARFAKRLGAHNAYSTYFQELDIRTRDRRECFQMSRSHRTGPVNFLIHEGPYAETHLPGLSPC